MKLWMLLAAGLTTLALGACANNGQQLGTKQTAGGLFGAVGGAVAGEIFEGERRYDLVVRLDDATRTDPDALGALIISTPTGARLPLSELASIAVEKGPVQVSRREGERFTTVQANVRGRDVAGYVAEIRARIATEVALPSGYRIDFGGAFENLQAATNRLMIVVPIALLLVFSLLYRTFSSVRTATIIFLCIPMSVVGGVAALMLRVSPSRSRPVSASSLSSVSPFSTASSCLQRFVGIGSRDFRRTKRSDGVPMIGSVRSSQPPPSPASASCR